MKKRVLALHWQMLIALALGACMGIIFGKWYTAWGLIVDGIGQIFLHALSMVVIPLVFLSTVLGISNMNNSKSMGRIAAKSFLYFIITAFLAALVGVLMTDLLRPGVMKISYDQINASDIMAHTSNVKQDNWISKIVAIVPTNIFMVFSNGEMLPIILFSLLFGVFVTKLSVSKKTTINNLLESLNDVILKITNFVIRFAPLGVFAIVMNMIGKQMDDVVVLMDRVHNFSFFVGVVWAGLLVMGGILLPIMIRLYVGVSPFNHVKQINSALMLALSTSSSYSAMPLLINDARDKSGISSNVAGFTIPLGVTFNKVGTIIYECVAVLFVAQASGVELTLLQQMSLMVVSIVTVLGSPSIPMAGVVVLAVLLKSMGLPCEMIGMFMAIDIFCDMPKTMINAYSVSCGALVVAKSEGEAIRI